MKQETAFRFSDWTLVLIFLALVFTASGRLALTNWVDDLEQVQFLAILGASLGLALGISRFPTWAQRSLMLAYSLLILPMHWIGLIKGEKTVLGQISSLWGQFEAILLQLASREPIKNPLFFMLVTGALFWFLGLLGGRELVRRRRVLWSLSLPTLLILIIQYYDAERSERIFILSFFFFLALALLGRLYILESYKNWQVRRVMVTRESLFDLGNTVLVLSALLAGLAWTIPPPLSGFPVAVQWWAQVSRRFEPAQERVDDLLAALQTPGEEVGQYGNLLGLGTAAAQGSGSLFMVRPPQAGPGHYYWRVRVYDTYQGGAWSNQKLQTRAYPGGDIESGPEGETQGEFTFSWQAGEQSSLIVPAEVRWVSRAGELLFFTPEGSNRPDLFGLRAIPQLRGGDHYTARAALTRPTIRALRAAGTEYPHWVMERYLQVPASLAARLGPLAREISANQPTVYDQTQAVTEYLRRNLAYAPTVQAPPPGTEPIEWFLFSWKSGYCNYYASSEVLLLRILGIPARMAAGYAQGGWEDGQFVVRGRDSHAWPEVYFPGIGWVPFEPTANQPAIERPSGETAAAAPTAGLPAEDPQLVPLPQPTSAFGTALPPGASERFPVTSSFIQYRTVLQWVIIIVGTFLCFYLVWRLHQRQPWPRRLLGLLLAFYRLRNTEPAPWLQQFARWVELDDVERSFYSINQCLGWLQHPTPPHLTPTERAALLAHLVPEAQKDISGLLTQHIDLVYRQRPSDARAARRASWRIRFYTLRAFFLRRLNGVSYD